MKDSVLTVDFKYRGKKYISWYDIIYYKFKSPLCGRLIMFQQIDKMFHTQIY